MGEDEREKAREAAWIKECADAGMMVPPKHESQMWNYGFEAGYEAGKADGIPQGVLDGYDAGRSSAAKPDKMAEALKFGLGLVKLSEEFDIPIGKGWMQFKELAESALPPAPMEEKDGQ
jgi:hypothetical protein